ncbi:GNAT family N-acetyltransferase [Bacillus marinisedimentorum]|uniref:GNAT family N-acetyltransferase n=1 Tax=Bacillus marinisedimentorum TaxID=1821260 RepID=UPI000872A1F9|nr:GNAT family N-acetyltransferase [Bacillus marinisedimentorum]
MIQVLDEAHLEETVRFLAAYNAKDEHYVAWLEQTKVLLGQQLEDALRDNVPILICKEAGKICGFLGISISREQGIARLLGPVVKPDYWNNTVPLLWNELVKLLPESAKEVRIAFYGDNTQCKKFAADYGFELYNAEMQMMYPKTKEHAFSEPEADIILIDFRNEDLEALKKFHPEGAYFTVNEMLLRLNENNRLVMAFSEGKAAGYVYYEMLPEEKACEVCFVNVESSMRGKGIGTRLIEGVIEDSFLQPGIDRVDISVRLKNRKAASLYRRMGFEEEKTVFAYRKVLSFP